MSGKKKNFTTQEKHLLLQILKSYKNILENKKTDNATANIKKQCWREIADKYNTSAIISESATGDQLRRLWQNLKTRQRDAMTKERQHRLATGGGGPCPDADIDPDVAEIAPALLVEIPEAIDCDQLENPDIASEQEEPNTSSEANAFPTMLNLFNANTTTDPTTRQPILVVPDDRTMTMTLDTNENIQYSDCEKKLRVQILKQEHKNREQRWNELHKKQIKQQEEKHSIEMQILQQKLKEIKQHEEKHSIEMQILQQKLRAELAQRELHNLNN
ncbi:myb/SANT-like DNA-binding domain-containing protein [Phthorimaea operculella]|nr:myb/SANT-like DNA-binding domain-containing protein [Phthorimaea operculella]